MRILIRSGKDPLAAVSAEATLAQNLFKGNVGNLLFSDSVHRLLSVPGTDVQSSSFLVDHSSATKRLAAQINEEFDVFVVPLANAFRETFLESLNRLTEIVQNLSIPTIVLGVGMAEPLDASTAIPDETRAAAERFMAAVLDRSHRVGVRGEHTRSFLRRLGFGDEHVEVIGCPSMFRHGPDLQVQKRAPAITPDSRFTMSLTLGAPGIGRMVNRHAAKYRRMTLVAQDRARLALLLWGQDPAVDLDPELPVHTGHPLYVQDRMRFFVDPHTWMEYMRQQDFACGTRIHGNLAALLAGTPAMVLAHDRRTLELAEYHSVPYRLMSSISDTTDVAELYEEADFTELHRTHRDRFATFARFLEEHDLEHVYQPGNHNPDYDRQMRAAAHAPAVHAVSAPGTAGQRAVVERLRWLRQDRFGDRDRRIGRWQPVLSDVPSSKVTPEVRRLQQRTRELEQRVAQLERLLQSAGEQRGTAERTEASSPLEPR